MFHGSEIQRILLSVTGALLLSATCVTAAVGPVKAAAPQPVAVQSAR